MKNIRGVLPLALVLALLLENVHGTDLEFLDEVDDFTGPYALHMGKLRERRQLKKEDFKVEASGTGKFPDIRLKAPLYNDGKTKIGAEGYYKKPELYQGIGREYGYGASIDHRIWTGEKGRSIDIGGSYMRHNNNYPPRINPQFTPNQYMLRGTIRF